MPDFLPRPHDPDRPYTREELAQIGAARMRAQQPLLADLTQVGVHTDDVYLLDWKTQPYPQALPILLTHLTHDDQLDDDLQATIARSLGVPPMRQHWDRLVQLYRDWPKSQTKDALAVALSTIARTTELDQLKEFIHDPTLGASRGAFIRRYVRLGKDIARTDITPFANDPDIGKEVTAVLQGKSPND